MQQRLISAMRSRYCAPLLAALAAVSALACGGPGAEALPRLTSGIASAASSGAIDIAFRGKGNGGPSHYAVRERRVMAPEFRSALGGKVRHRSDGRPPRRKPDVVVQTDKPHHPKRHPKKDETTETRPPRHHPPAHVPKPSRIACIGGHVRDGGCVCPGGSHAQRVGVLLRYVCGPVLGHHRRPSIPLATTVAGAGVAAAAATAVAATPPPPRGNVAGGMPPPQRGSANAVAQEEVYPDEVLFWLDNALPESTEARVADRLRLQILTRTRSALIGKRFVHARISDGRAIGDVVAELGKDRRISGPQPNYLYRQQQGANVGGTAGLQYALDRIEWPAAHRMASGRGATVAIIDTALDSTHPDLGGADIRELDASPPKGPDDKAHATALAGIIAGRGTALGIAPDARIFAVRAFTSGARGPVGSTASILRALEQAVDNGVRVVNLSFAGPRDPSLEKAVSAAAARDIILIAAAGNAGRGSPAAYPAAYPDVIAVTATDAQDRLYTQANIGNYVAIAAPGVDVLVPAPGGAHDLKSGTSFAAAHVTGVVALMLEQNPRLSPNAARRKLSAGALDLGAPGPDEEFGAGRVNAALSLNNEMRAAR